jgi:hypothetical protein
MNFIKNDLCNRLDTNLEACLLVFVQDHAQTRGEQIDLFTTATFTYGELQERLKSM